LFCEVSKAGRFGRGKQKDVEEGIDRAAALETWLADGIEQAMNKFNG